MISEKTLQVELTFIYVPLSEKDENDNPFGNVTEDNQRKEEDGFMT